jgi:pimeloyl-ACP methyl ester carboxylesterase
MDVMVTGNGSQLVVAVHGIQGTGAVWQPIASRLSGEATFVMPNLRGRCEAVRGHGVEDYQLEQFADDLSSVIEAYAWDRDYLLAGWSFGVTVALQYLVRPGALRPTGLILASGTPAIGEVSWFSTTEPSVLAREIADRERRFNLAGAAEHDAVAWTWQAVRSTDQRALLPSITVPTLIFHGSADEECPLVGARELECAIRGSERRVLGGGHDLPITHADAMASSIRRFINHSTETEQV